jgi:hypothetical protein
LKNCQGFLFGRVPGNANFPFALAKNKAKSFDASDAEHANECLQTMCGVRTEKQKGKVLTHRAA